MGYQETWIGLTVSVMVFMFCFEAVQIWGDQLGEGIGPENVTIDRQDIKYSYPKDVPVVNGSTSTKDEGGWLSWIGGLMNVPQNEQAKQGGSYSDNSFTSVIKNVFINGTYGFSNFIHATFGLPNGAQYIHTWFIGFVQYFLIIGNMLIIMQVVSKFLPGG